MSRRVVVTGMGAVSPLGLSVKETWANALEARSGVARITRFPVENYDAQIAAEVKGFNPDDFVPKKEQKKMDLFIQYGLAAFQMAWKESGIDINQCNPERVGVYVGAGIGGLPGIERQYDVIRDRGPGRMTPFFIPMVISNLAAGQIAIQIGAKGPNFCITSACATGAHSIGEAMFAIQRNDADIMIAGGAEAVVCPLAIGGFAAMKALSTRNDNPEAASRPFDKDRDGFVLGEGAAVLILEEYEHAKRRGAKIYGEVTGYGATCDAYHLTNPAPEGEGAGRAMMAALKRAHLNTDKIGYVNAHGTSTPAGDELESQAIQRVLGSQADKVLVSSTKSMTGHLLGAAGALESVFCLMALEDQIVPPTKNLDNPSEGCTLDYVPHTARKANIQHAMNNSFGFGGTNACLIFSKV